MHTIANDSVDNALGMKDYLNRIRHISLRFSFRTCVVYVVYSDLNAISNQINFTHTAQNHNHTASMGFVQ